MRVIKRNGAEVDFDSKKIQAAIEAANNAVREKNGAIGEKVVLRPKQIEAVVEAVVIWCQEQADLFARSIDVEEIQDHVEFELMHENRVIAQAYTHYRAQRQMQRAGDGIIEKSVALVRHENEVANQENSNKNTLENSVQRDYMAGFVSREFCDRNMPSEVIKAHKDGLIHVHDTDYDIQRMHNCDLINLEDMLQNGTVISETMIESPKSFYTACNVTTQIVAQVASAQYGGQSFSLSHLAPFVDVSRQKFRKNLAEQFKEAGIKASPEQVNEVAEKRVLEEIAHGIQTIQYQLVTLMTTNGQAPFVTMFMYLDEAKTVAKDNGLDEAVLKKDLALCIEEVLRQRMQGVKNEKGIWVTPAFPKLIYVLDEDNLEPNSPYYYLTEMSAKCTAKRMVPDYISAKVMKELKGGDLYTCMGCRSFLTPDRFTDAGIGNIANAKNYKPGKHKYYGRFNQGVCTINLPDVALTSGGDEETFWSVLSDRLELCHKALQWKHKKLLGTVSDVAPILWQHGALARLGKGEVIDPLLFNGYSTISLGYAGLYETVKYMTGKSHTEEGGKEFALAVMQTLNDACKKWKAEENIDYSVYGTPLESTTYKFAKALQKRFGLVEGVSDHNYITNSYHVCVREEINAFDKLAFEAPFQPLSPGGAISYVEVPNMQDNIPAVLSVMRFIYDNIMYAELNTKSDYCENCGYDGEIKIVSDDHGKLVWECPNCGNRDQNKMAVARRTCGYIGTQFWNQGRTQEIQQRVLHL